jgi:uncharacterized protein (DUF2141 family)
MKTGILCIIVLAMLIMGADVAAQSTIEVTVENITETKGTIRIGLFSSEKNFLKETADGKIIKASASSITVKFENLKSGAYAVSVIHDENENGDLDTNMMGIPSEGFAFGNNAMGMFGPPSFDNAKVEVKGNDVVKQLLKLKYF